MAQIDHSQILVLVPTLTIWLWLGFQGVDRAQVFWRSSQVGDIELTQVVEVEVDERIEYQENHYGIGNYHLLVHIHLEFLGEGQGRVHIGVIVADVDVNQCQKAQDRKHHIQRSEKLARRVKKRRIDLVAHQHRDDQLQH